jgi:DNA replicative helicase MCM subunit Mcm2 (Cdc46/Mcm family)
MITSDLFDSLDWWFYIVGVNVIPADTKNKKVNQSWTTYQATAMASEEFEEMKKVGDFIRGAAIITGKVWRGDHVGLYLNGIDLDNSKAIQEICEHKVNSQVVTMQGLAESTLLEQHPDAPGKLHMYVYSRHPFKNKSSDAGKPWFNKETMPAIEVKGTKCLMFCTPSMHEDGHRYQFINHRLPTISDDLERIINDLLSTHGIDYLSKDDKRGRETQQKNDKSRVINEGSRHTELLREMNARLHDFIRTKPLEEIKQMCIKFNNLYCRPPLEIKEFEKMWNDAVIHVAEEEQEKETEKEAIGSSYSTASTEFLTVSEAIRRSRGNVAVRGMIVGLSSVTQVVTQTTVKCHNCGNSKPVLHRPPLFSLPSHPSTSNRTRQCDGCGEPATCVHENESAMLIQLQDEKKQKELENLNVVLLGKDTVDVRNGEKAQVLGDLYVVQQKANSSRVTFLFARGIEYERPQDENIVITEEDLSKLEELSQQPDAIARLVSMVAPTVIGHDDMKLGIILMYIGAPEKENGDFRGRIHGIAVGPPGSAKTKLAYAAYRLGQPHSRYSSTQGASGKSITAIIDKDGNSHILRNGVLPQAKGSVCVLNEIASLSMEDQKHLFDAMEEGKFTIDKYAFHKEIDSPTTVLGTTNPATGDWYAGIIERDQIPLRKEVVDRNDFIFVFVALKTREEKVNYAGKRLAVLKNKDIKENHDFLRKVIQHAKSFNPELSEEADAMIIDFWSRLDTMIFPTNRVLETIVRTSIAFARLRFSNMVTAEITKESIDFLTKMYKAFDKNVVVVQDPREVVCHAIAKFLMANPNIAHDFQDCMNYAVSASTVAEAYLGKSPVDNNSSKYRDIADRFKQGLIGDGLISISNVHPLRLMFKVSVPDQNKEGDSVE